jgi:hypothetical protein
MFLIICLIFVSSCKTSGTGGSNNLKNSPESGSVSGPTIDCPYGDGIDGSTSKYQSCDSESDGDYRERRLIQGRMDDVYL